MTKDTTDASASPGRLFAWMKSPSDLKAIGYILAIAGGFLLLTTLLHLPHGPEHWSADLRTKYLSKRLGSQHERIALIYVTDKTLTSYAYLSPTDRLMLADLVRAVDAAGPAVIGFDFIIDRPTEPGKDDTLFKVLRDAKAKVVVGAIDEPKVKGQGKSFQEMYLEKVNRPIGHLYFDAHHGSLVISDHVIRQMAHPHDKHDHKKTFARQLVDAVGTYPEPKSTYISWLLDPWDKSETFQSLPAEQVLDRGGAKLPLADILKDKIVLIGGNFIDRDQHLLPLSVLGDGRFPGLFVHAQIVAQLFDERSLFTLSWLQQLVVYVLAAGLGFWIGRRQTQIHLVAELLSVIVLVLAGVAAFYYANLILPYTGLLLTWLSGLAVGHYTRHHHA